MIIYGKMDIHKTLFKDLKKGDVFFFYKDYQNDALDLKLYMRCGHTDELSAVNLTTGICYGFDSDLPVEIVDATLNIKQRTIKG